MAKDKGVALAVLGVVAVLAIVGLVLLFTQSNTGMVARGGGYAGDFGSFIALPAQYEPVAATGGPYQARGRNARGYETGGPRYYIQAGADTIGDYPSARYSGRLPGGNPYTS